MAHMLLSKCPDIKQFMESFPNDEIDSILKQGSEFLDSYLDAAAEKFKKERGRKLKNTTIDTKVESEQNPLLLSQQENEPEFKRLTRTASKVGCQKMNDLPMHFPKCEEDNEEDYITHSNHSVFSNCNIKQRRISEELDSQDKLGTSEFEGLKSTCNLMPVIEEIEQSIPSPLPPSCLSSIEANIEQKPLILNTPVILSDKDSSKLDLGLNVEFHSDGSDKEAKTNKKSKQTNTKPKKINDDSSSSGGLSSISSPQPMRATCTKTRALANPATFFSDVQADLNVTYNASSDKTAEPAVQSQIFGINDIYSGESSEEEEERISEKIFPKWALPDNRRRILRIQSQIPFEMIKKFIVCGEKTPDLTKIFQNIPKRTLTRTSSAVWNTPPIHMSKYN